MEEGGSSVPIPQGRFLHALASTDVKSLQQHRPHFSTLGQGVQQSLLGAATINSSLPVLLNQGLIHYKNLAEFFIEIVMPATTTNNS
jgi:hypothetical protein